ncbi:Serine endopeptidase/trypsin-like serine proteinase family protein [Alcanivorax xiamenensis]|uniref:Serine endopeptidase/trypsin-like serine proteinase family protein n=1 Tax=Alcanivorax xiamenensis TaxID=1177156 RepID=A0ABQ6Y669_9GAMM|nr:MULTISPECIES: serine protease [Alcanivorax]KAF0804822.1 Serine endopeptidase/trypsin-like serine proteinase family protein [Alcanivorax xiamenensis]
MVHRLGFFVLALSAPVVANDFQTYIVGGEDATANWPWAALVEIDFGAQGRGACSGSLLSPDQVLTAAHCFFDENGQQVDASAITVHVGSAPNGPNSTHAADIYHLHSGYDNTANPIGNDIALIQLSSAIDVSPLPSLVDGAHFDELLTRDAPGRDEALTAIGWGATTTDRNNQAISPTLQQVALDYVPFSTCNQSWNGFLIPVQSSVICAAELNPQDNEIENTCLGDSGGPLILGDDPAPYIVGLTSFGSADSCQGGRPTVFTRVLNMVDFVEENVPLVDVSVNSDPQRYYGSPGGQVTVPATVTNGSLRNTAHNVVIQANTDDASADASLQWSDCGSGGLLAGNDQCTLTSPLTAGADSSGQVEVNHNGATETDATLTLEVGSDEDEYRIKNNQAPITVVFSNRSDLTVSAEQTAGHLDSDGQGIATVAVRVTNLSTVNAANDATVALTLPAGTTARGDDTVQCDTLCWVGPMASGASADFTLTLTSGTPETGTLTLTVTDQDGEDFPQDNNQHDTAVSYSGGNARDSDGGGSGGGGGSLGGWWLLALAGLALRAQPPRRNNRSR